MLKTALIAALAIAAPAAVSAQTIDFDANGTAMITFGGSGGVQSVGYDITGTGDTSSFTGTSLAFSDLKLTSALGNYDLGAGSASYANGLLTLMAAGGQTFGIFTLDPSSLSTNGSTFVSISGTVDPGNAVPYFTIPNGTPDGLLVGIQVGTTGTFTGTLEAAVPEPATWAMMISGFGLVGVGLRRRAVRTLVQAI